MTTSSVREIPGNQKHRVSPPQILGMGFIAVIALGAILLKLPFATTSPITWMDAFFTATSATTVTGLTVIDTPVVFTLFGQIVILILIQIGGLGIITFAILFFLVLGIRISVRQRLVIQNALNQNHSGGMVMLVKRVLIFALSIEGIAAFLLALYWGQSMDWGKSIYFSIFHTVSAFNNAGFALTSDSLAQWTGDPIVNLIFGGLILIGGLGFTVLINLWESRHLQDLTLHTKFMLVGTFVINAFAFLMILVLEYHNPETLGNLPLDEKLWGSYFQTITTRTAGFHTIDTGGLREATLFMILLLMYIGAGSASAGGGIKLTTFFILLLSVVKILRGNQDAVAFKRTIQEDIFMRAFALVVTSFMFIFMVIFILSLTEDASFLDLAFEVVSAFGTVGLTTGMTPHLSIIGQIGIMMLMFIGKLGPLTLMFSLTAPQTAKIRYPKGKLFLG